MLSQSEIERRLSPYVPRIQSVIFDAWADWIGSGKAGKWKRRRARANYMWEELACRAEQAFRDDEHVHIHPKNQSCWFVIDDLVYRFKKSDANGYTSNVPTQAALDYHDQQEDLPGVPAVQRIEITYVLNQLETSIEDILLVARDQNTVLWRSSIMRRDDNGNVVSLVPGPAVGPVAPAVETIRIPLKSVPIKKQNESDS